MEYLSNGIFYFKWDHYSNVSCKLRFFLFFLSESLSQYLLVWLTIERLMAFYRPFDIRLFATKRNGLIILLLLIIISLLFAAPALYHFDLSTHPNILGAIICAGVYKNTAQIVVFIICTCILCEVLPQFTVLVSTLLLGLKVYSSSRSRVFIRVLFRNASTNSNLKPTPSPTHEESKRSVSSKIIIRNDIKLARSIYILASLELVITLLPLLPWIAYAILEFIGCSKEVIAQTFSAGNLISDIMIIIRLWNIYIYYLTIPAFKNEVNRIICAFRNSPNVPRPSFSSRERSYTVNSLNRVELGH